MRTRPSVPPIAAPNTPPIAPPVAAVAPPDAEAKPEPTPLEKLLDKHKTEPWKHVAAIMKRGWLSNSEVSDADYLLAVYEAANEEIR